MKSLKRIIAFICVATMMLSMSAFAAVENGQDLGVAMKASKTTVAPGETFTLTVYAANMNESFGVIPTGAIEYNNNEFTFVDPTNDGNLYIGAGSQIGTGNDSVAFMYTNEATFDPAKMWTFDVTACSTPGTYTIDLYFMWATNAGKQPADSSDTLTITVKEATQEPVVRPTGLPTTYTLGEKTYTDVPNKEVTVTTTGATTGKVTLTYWYNGVDDKTAIVDFTTNAAALTGTGNATFKVAVMGVPRTVVIKDIAVAFDAVN